MTNPGEDPRRFWRLLTDQFLLGSGLETISEYLGDYEQQSRQDDDQPDSERECIHRLSRSTGPLLDKIGFRGRAPNDLSSHLDVDLAMGLFHS